jgi:hypothetical protein
MIFEKFPAGKPPLAFPVRYTGGMFRSAVLLFAASVGLVSAQTSPNPGPPVLVGPVPQALRLFLGLTDEQVKLIADKNIEFNRFVAEKNRRQRQVQAEIAAETRKETLDPMALGLRYMELELIRREIRAAEDKLRADLRKALSGEQLAKLDALQKALELLPLYMQAAGVHLLSPPPPGVPVGVIRQPFPRMTGESPDLEAPDL